MSQILINALRETLLMVVAAGGISIVFGVFVGMLIANMSFSQYPSIRAIYHTLFRAIKILRAIPFLLLMLLFIPMTNVLIEWHFSFMTATILPLAVAGSLYLTIKVNDITFDLLQKWAQDSKVMGISFSQKLKFILIPESLPKIIQESANACALLVGFSAIAGALGAGGLGQLAIEKSIHDPDPLCVIMSIAILVAMQQLIQYTGTLILTGSIQQNKQGT